MAKFKCKASGTVVEFTYQHDIDSMMSHPSYDLVDDNGNIIEDEENNIDKVHVLPLKPPVPQPTRGRPRKHV